ncbi:MAG: hypothetical protein MJ132_01725 [Clostridia bacterium]|nr:hypothetical protein [Clostridia bacterium]
MKKKYTKPDLYFESFRLSANIATCSQHDFGKSNLADMNSCSFTFYGVGNAFLIDSICDFTTQNGGLEMLCYHTAPSESLFNS